MTLPVLLGGQSLVANICQARVSAAIAPRTVEVDVNLLMSATTPGGRLSPFQSGPQQVRSVFVIAVQNQRLIDLFAGNGNAIVPFLIQEAHDDRVAIQTQSLSAGIPSGKFVQNHGGNIVSSRTLSVDLAFDSLDDLTIFAGVLSTRVRRRRDMNTIITLDNLSIIRNAQRLETNVLLYTDEQKSKIWIGPAFKDMLGNWYRPLAGRPGDERLYSTTVPNTKVVFESDLEQLTAPIKNLSAVLYGANRGIDSQATAVQRLKSHETNYFSSLYTAKIDSGDLALTLAFNKLGFFRRNGLFGQLIKNRQDLLGSFTLAGTKIFRKRVTTNRPVNELTGGGANSSYPESEVIVTEDPTFSGFASAENTVLWVSTKDTGAQDLTYGYYAYGVELTFIDKTQDKIKDLVDNPETGLRLHIARLSELYKLASHPQNYDLYARKYLPSFISSLEGSSLVLPASWGAVGEAIQKYVSTLNIFYDSLRSTVGSSLSQLQSQIYDMTARPDNGPVGLLRLINLLSNLSAEIERFMGTTNTYNPGSAAEMNISHSKFGGSGRLLKVKHYFNEFVDAEDLVNYGYNYLLVPGSTSSGPDEPFKIVPYADMISLLALEDELQGTGGSAAASSAMQVTLTPTTFNLYGHLENLNSDDFNKEEHDQALASLLTAANMYKKSPINLAQFFGAGPSGDHTPAHANTINNSLRMMGHHSCTIEVESSSEDNAGAFIMYPTSLALNNNCKLDAAEKLSEQSPFVINKEGPSSLPAFIMSANNQDQGSLRQKQLLDLSVNFLSYLTQTDYFTPQSESTYASISNVTDKKVFRNGTTTTLTFLQGIASDAPSAAGAAAQNGPPGPTMSAVTNRLKEILIGQNITSGKVYPPIQQLAFVNALESSPTSASQTASFALQYGTVKKAQYLSGFRIFNNTLMIGGPIWLDLTRIDIDNFSQSGRQVLCRFVDPASEFKPFLGINAPIYNSLFILSNTNDVMASNVTGNPNSTTIPGVSTTLADSNLDMVYATSPVDGISQNNNLREENQNSYVDLKNGLSGLYTNGEDYMLPNGAPYTGAYHIYVKDNGQAMAMVGKEHIPTSHEVLKPVSELALLELQKAIQRAAVTSTADQGPSGGSY